MRIAAFVQPQLHGKLERAVRSDDSLIQAESWSGLTTIVRRHRIDIAVVDPFARRHDDVQQVTSLATHFPDLPILVYTVAGPSTARSILALNNAAISHVCLHPFEGTGPDFREEMTNAIEDTLSSRFVEGVAERIELLPEDLRRGVQRMFAKPEQFKTASDLALYAEVTPLRMYRCFETAELCSPKRLLVAARLLRFYGHTHLAGLSPHWAAKKLGYPDSRVLARYSLNSLGVALTELIRMDEAKLLPQLVKMVRAEGSIPAPHFAPRVGARARPLPDMNERKLT
ncbi:MAG TPA: hypothetical protein VES88_12820 [Gemmatimonadaceae bacterium]|nr:hypothetical protein [Gemmatimonadaceae bacterium]